MQRYDYSIHESHDGGVPSVATLAAAALPWDCPPAPGLPVASLAPGQAAELIAENVRDAALARAAVATGDWPAPAPAIPYHDESAALARAWDIVSAARAARAFDHACQEAAAHAWKTSREGKRVLALRAGRRAKAMARVREAKLTTGQERRALKARIRAARRLAMAERDGKAPRRPVAR
jgi:hypothetical protein